MRTQTSSQNQIISVSLPQALVDQAQRMAQETKRSRSQMVQQALKQYFLFTRWKELQSYGVARSIELGLKPEDTERLINECRKTKIQNSR